MWGCRLLVGSWMVSKTIHPICPTIVFRVPQPMRGRHQASRSHRPSGQRTSSHLRHRNCGAAYMHSLMNTLNSHHGFPSNDVNCEKVLQIILYRALTRSRNITSAMSWLLNPPGNWREPVDDHLTGNENGYHSLVRSPVDARLGLRIACGWIAAVLRECLIGTEQDQLR